jgi:phosphoglycerate dehydrogenase-like enzyme
VRAVALLTRQWPQPGHAALSALCETRMLMPGADLSGDFFRTFNRDVTILCSSFLDDLNEALIDALPALELIAHFGTWRHPTEPLRERGIRVTDTGAAGADEAADFALTQLLAIRRRLTQPLPETGAKRTLDQGLAPSVHGITVGLGGRDAVATALAVRCRALGMHVLDWAPDDCGPLPGVERLESIEVLAARCDAISLHGPGDAPLLTADAIAQCRRDTVVINATDARLIDEVALIDALRDYRIAGAALDVCRDAASLTACPNTLLTPQLATNTPRARDAMAERVVANVSAYLAGSTPPNPVP